MGVLVQLCPFNTKEITFRRNLFFYFHVKKPLDQVNYLDYFESFFFFFFKMYQNFIEQAQPQLHARQKTGLRPQTGLTWERTADPNQKNLLLQTSSILQTTTQLRLSRLQQ
jgi:hypothetical protein